MNTQFRALVEQAGYGRERWNSTEQFENFLQTLVASVIQECATVVQNAVDQREPASTYVDTLRKHFGVE
jgi:hypothetical protein